MDVVRNRVLRLNAAPGALPTNDAALDGDEDGSSNLAEYSAGTNPTLSDSDGDGLSDGTGESAAGTGY